MDEADRGQACDALFQRAALAAHQNRTARGRRMANLICENCDKPIPEKRRKAVPGCRLCVFCQAQLERSR